MEVPQEGSGGSLIPRIRTKTTLGEPLTAREYEVLAEMVEGDPARVAAERLGVTLQTFKNHMSTAYIKLGVTSLTSAFKAMGWLEIRDRREGPSDRRKPPTT